MSDFAGADALSLAQLKDIIELANFINSKTFLKVMGFAIADRIKDMSVEAIAEYMVLEMGDKPTYDEDADCVHPSTSEL
ncbi:unnamed protein product [Caenorhabditis sp. 36 PRJEB53466]|nr:unnamed protein product [Caenorhabditis sp. 36 PRJEB53466]